MIATNTQLYMAVEELSKALRNAGYDQWSADLSDALVISSVPGEVLGETRLQLQKLQTSQVPNLLGITCQLDEALFYLDRVLGPYT
jgi:hypothetical protein